MRARVRALDRYLGCLAAQAKLTPIAEDYVERWIDAVEGGWSPPDPTDLFMAAAAVNVPVLSPGPITGYLQSCARRREIPEEERIVLAIAHAYAESNPFENMEKTCHCPAKRPLVGQGRSRPNPFHGP